MYPRAIPTEICSSCGCNIAKNRAFGAIMCFQCKDLAVRASLNACSKVKRAIKSGKLRPISEHECVDCGKPAKYYDHRDYDRPLAVVPVCHGCNVRRGPGKPFVAFIKRESRHNSGPTARRRKILAARSSGKTMAQIADQFDMSRQRVSQLLKIARSEI